MKNTLKKSNNKCIEENSYDDIKETIEDLLEEANSSIDKMGNQVQNREKPKQLINYEKDQEIIQRTNNQLRKPQQNFMDLIDNSYNPFVPLISQKYFGLESLPANIIKVQEDYQLNPEKYRKVNIKEAKKPQIITTHPYLRELNELQFNLPDPKVAIQEVKYGSLSTTPLIYVETEEQLQVLKQKLESVPEFAVDLEHHNYRTYLGITCLMQISTRDCDYIVDVITLRRSVNKLAEVFYCYLIDRLLQILKL